MAGRQSQGDWVVQPETWLEPQVDPNVLLGWVVSAGQTLMLPLTVNTSWISGLGIVGGSTDQTNRFREMEATEMAVATRGDIFCHFTPPGQETWDSTLNNNFSVNIWARITRHKQAPGDQLEANIAQNFDPRQALYSNDEYVWQQMRHSTNVASYNPATVVTRSITTLQIVHQFTVNARYRRRLSGEDNMVLLVGFGNFHNGPAWYNAASGEQYVTPNLFMTVTPRLRTFLTA